MIIGSGIFIVPATIAGHLHALGPILLAWMLGGLLVLFGALTLAELSSILPQAGGPYVYLKQSYGRVWGFLYTWNHYFIQAAGTLAALSVAFVTYLAHFVPALSPQNHFFSYQWSLFGHPQEFSVGWTQLVAITMISIVTCINVWGVRLAGWVMTVFTSAKVLVILGLAMAIFTLGKGSASNFLPWWPDHWTFEMTHSFGLAMIPILWTYDGWSLITLSAGEMKNPGRNVPLSLLLGTVLVICLYLLANLAYAYAIPVESMIGAPRIAADVALVVLGPIGATLVIAGILCSTFGTMNGSLLSNPRSIYAAADDGTFPKAFAKIHTRFQTPVTAIVVLGVWGSLLTLSGSFSQIISYVVFGSWFFYALTALSVIVLRKTMPDAPRPYRAWGYPYLTLAFVAIAGWFLYITLIRDPRNAAIGIALLLVSLPFYSYWTKKSRRT